MNFLGRFIHALPIGLMIVGLGLLVGHIIGKLIRRVHRHRAEGFQCYVNGRAIDISPEKQQELKDAIDSILISAIDEMAEKDHSQKD